MNNGQKLEALFQTLGDANRLRILRTIGNESRSVSEIVQITELSQPLVSHHLRVLREQNILKTKREGPFIYYEINDRRILDALGIFSELLVNTGSMPRPRANMFSCSDRMMKFLNNKT